jgi:mono/diheme cytochrome c family protein
MFGIILATKRGKLRATICGLISLAALAALPTAAVAADAGNGAVLAKRWCASCHIVAADQKTGNTQTPPFSAIAKTPGLDAPKLAYFLLLPHPKMPDMNLTRSEAADLAAYIARQK